MRWLPLLIHKQLLVLFEGDAAVGPLAEEGGAEFGEDAIADVAEEGWENLEYHLEEAERGQALDDLADGGAADEEILGAIGAAHDEHDRLGFREVGMGRGDLLLESLALFGAETDAVGEIGFLDAVDPAVAERAFTVEEEEQGVALRGEALLRGGCGERVHA